MFLLLLSVILSELHEKPWRKDWVTEKSKLKNLWEGHHFFATCPTFCRFFHLLPPFCLLQIYVGKNFFWSRKYENGGPCTHAHYIYIYIFIYIYPETTFNINKKTKKKVFLHTLSAYNSLLILYKIYSSDSRECLCTRWSYGKAYVYLIIAPAPCWKIPINNKLAIPKCQSLLLGENYTEKKNVRVKIA